MKTIGKEVLYANNDRTNKPSGTVYPGEMFKVKTELATGDWLHDQNTLWSPEKTLAANPCVCIYVEGAEPGDVLAVEIHHITPARLGYMAIETRDSVFPQVSAPLFGEVFANTVRVEEGFIHLADEIRVLADPMIGTLGTTIDHGSLSHIEGGFFGGNMDVQEVRAGAIVRLPVLVPGALLNVGDVHARQSDGEVSAVEVAGEVTLTVHVEKRDRPIPGPRIEDDQYLMTVALHDSEKQAFETAFRDLLHWLADEYRLDPKQAYILLGAVMEARCTRYLGPGNFPYVCKIRKSCIPPRE